MSEECYLDFSFLITCNKTLQPPQAFYQDGKLPVMSISHENGTMRVRQPVSRVCYNSSGYEIQNIPWEGYSSKFPISDSCNKFIGVGCKIIAYFTEPSHTITGCKTECDPAKKMMNEWSEVIGFCERKIPSEVRDFSMDIEEEDNHSSVSNSIRVTMFFLPKKGVIPSTR
ncbi:hypothetical protein LguiB_017770 [Lonicera macranthoides]